MNTLLVSIVITLNGFVICCVELGVGGLGFVVFYWCVCLVFGCCGVLVGVWFGVGCCLLVYEFTIGCCV